MTKSPDHEGMYRVPVRMSKNGQQDLFAERWERQDVDDRGIVLAVYRGWVDASSPAYRAAAWRAGRLTGLWRALLDEDPELEVAAAEHLEETTSLLSRRIRDWLEQGTAERADMEDLLQQVESVKQLAQILSRRSETSRHQPGAFRQQLTDPLASVRASER